MKLFSSMILLASIALLSASVSFAQSIPEETAKASMLAKIPTQRGGSNTNGHRNNSDPVNPFDPSSVNANDGGSHTGGLACNEGGSHTNGANKAISIAQAWSENKIANLKFMLSQIRILAGSDPAEALEQYKEVLNDLQSPASDENTSELQQNTWIYQYSLMLTTLSDTLAQIGTHNSELRKSLDEGYEQIINFSNLDEQNKNTLSQYFILKWEKDFAPAPAQTAAINSFIRDELKNILANDAANLKKEDVFKGTSDERKATVEAYAKLFTWMLSGNSGIESQNKNLKDQIEKLKKSTEDFSTYETNLNNTISMLN